MKVRRPDRVDPLLWEQLPHAARLALASHYARTPERREQLRRASMQHTAAQLDRAVKTLERAMKRPGGDHDEQ